MKITETSKRALQIIKENPGINPREFAMKMWPDSNGWRHYVKCGHGSHRGGGMYLAGGGYLGRLRKAGYIKLGNYLTQQGREALKE